MKDVYTLLAKNEYNYDKVMISLKEKEDAIESQSALI